MVCGWCWYSFLGGRPVRQAAVRVGGQTAVLSLSTRTWLSYRHHNNFLTAPLAYGALDAASQFYADGDCVVAISQDSMRFFTIEKLGQLFNQQVRG